MRAAWARRSTPSTCSAPRIRWSTVWGEIPSSTAISLEDKCWSTRSRASNWPWLSRATRAAIVDSAWLADEELVPPFTRLSVKSLGISTKGRLPPKTRLGKVPSPSSDNNILYSTIVRSTPMATTGNLCVNSGRCCPIVMSNGAGGAANRKAGGEGWIRTSVGRSPADLQSAAFNHSATSPVRGRRARWRRGLRMSMTLSGVFALQIPSIPQIGGIWSG